MASLINENCVDVEDEIDEKGDNITGGRHPWWDLAQGRNSTDCRLLISPEPQSPTNRPPPTDPVSFSHFLSFHLFCLTQLSFRDLRLTYYSQKIKLELPYSARLGSALLKTGAWKVAAAAWFARILRPFAFWGFNMLCSCCLPCLRLSRFQCPLVSVSFSLSVHIALYLCNSIHVPIFKYQE